MRDFTVYGRSSVFALLCAALALGWQALIVSLGYNGNWTALFYTGAKFTIPPALTSENIYIFVNSFGFDAQFSHYVAHDPFLQQDLSRYIDLPAWRYCRILVPLLAFLLAAGRQEYVDEAYVSVTLLSVFLGVYWLSRYAVLHHRHAFWGAAFLLVPAVVISLERLTVDIALSALCVGFAIYSSPSCSLKLFLIQMAACLTRETGFLLVAATAVPLLWQRRFRRALLSLAAAMPCIGWYVYIYLKLDGAYVPHVAAPVQSLIESTHQTFPLFLSVHSAIRLLDFAALLGVWIGSALGLRILFKSRPHSLPVAAGLFGMLALFVLSAEEWTNFIDYGRVFSPVLILIGLNRMAEHRWLNRIEVALLLLILPRVIAHFCIPLWHLASSLQT